MSDAPPAATAGARRVLVAVRWPVGGIRAHLLASWPGLAARGFAPTFVAPAGPTFDDLRAPAEAIPGAELHPVPMRGRHFPLRGVARDLLRSGRFALSHAHGLSVGALVAWGDDAGVPLLVTSHDVFPPGRHEGLLDAAKRRALAHLLGRAKAIVSVTEDARANLLDHLPWLRGEVAQYTIPHGIPLPREGGGAPASREALGVPPGAFLVGFLGRFTEPKGFVRLLDAVAGLLASKPPRPLHLLAVSSGDYEPAYREEVARRGLSPSVTFRPAALDPLPILRALDLVAMPSLWEASGLLAMQALVAGTPLLASSCIGLREIVARTPARTAPPEDVAAWTAALRSAMESPWNEAARDFVPQARHRFDVTRTVSALADLYASLASP